MVAVRCAAATIVPLLFAACGAPPADDGDLGYDQPPRRDGSVSDGGGLVLDGAIGLDDGALTTEDAGPDVWAPPAGCATQVDGTKCAPAPNVCHTDGVCLGGVCAAPKRRADGYPWKQGDPYARCCGGQPVITNTNANCGACGIACNAQNGESCQELGGRWFCRGCTTSSGCWSKCCSKSFVPYSCAASDCQGNCSDTYCPPGTKCVPGNGVSSNYCAY
jgi:hypothetical protein